MTAKRLKIYCSLFLLMTLLIWAVIWDAAHNLTHPERRSLQSYHLEWLNSPGSHGIKITSYACANGLAPCLMVSPDSQAGPSERGQKLRKQLIKTGVNLGVYGKTRGILVLLHGRKGRKEDLLPVAERFAAAGFNCVIPDLPAHGESPLERVSFAANSFEARLPEVVLNDARRFFRDNASPAGLWGMSMGGAFVTRSAAVSPERWKAIVIVSSFDTLDGVVRDQLAHILGPLSGWAVEVVRQVTKGESALDLSKISPATWSKDITQPVLVVHGGDDRLISIDHGARLYKSLSSTHKRWVTVPGGTHSNVLITPMPVYSIMSAWFIEHVQ